MSSRCPNPRTLVGVICAAVTAVLWALCFWQLFLRFAPGKPSRFIYVTVQLSIVTGKILMIVVLTNGSIILPDIFFPL